jgi:hypothetical protein
MNGCPISCSHPSREVRGQHNSFGLKGRLVHRNTSKKGSIQLIQIGSHRKTILEHEHNANDAFRIPKHQVNAFATIKSSAC